MCRRKGEGVAAPAAAAAVSSTTFQLLDFLLPLDFTGLFFFFSFLSALLNPPVFFRLSQQTKEDRFSVVDGSHANDSNQKRHLFNWTGSDGTFMRFRLMEIK